MNDAKPTCGFNESQQNYIHTTYIHTIARMLISSIPDCIDRSDEKRVIAYRVGVMKLAETLTGQNIMEVDAETISKLIGKNDGN